VGLGVDVPTELASSDFLSRFTLFARLIRSRAGVERRGSSSVVECIAMTSVRAPKDTVHRESTTASRRLPEASAEALPTPWPGVGARRRKLRTRVDTGPNVVQPGSGYVTEECLRPRGTVPCRPSTKLNRSSCPRQNCLEPPPCSEEHGQTAIEAPVASWRPTARTRPRPEGGQRSRGLGPLLREAHPRCKHPDPGPRCLRSQRR
jgi:hypothetical protein